MVEVMRRRPNIGPLAQCVVRWWPACSVQDKEFVEQLSDLSKNASAPLCQGQMFWNEPGWVNSVSIVSRVWDGCSGDHPTTYPLGTLGSFPRLRGLGSEADHFCLSIAEVEIGGSIPLLTSMHSWKAEGHYCFLLIF
jgi:hypothetical protein